MTSIVWQDEGWEYEKKVGIQNVENGRWDIGGRGRPMRVGVRRSFLLRKIPHFSFV